MNRNADGTHNFDVLLMIGTDVSTVLFRAHLRGAVNEFFAGDEKIALSYFAGHDYIDDSGGWLWGSDCEFGQNELASSDVMRMADRSKARNEIIVLDSRHGGQAVHACSGGWIVDDQPDRLFLLVDEDGYHIEHFLHRGAVERFGGLIGQVNACLSHRAAGDGERLTLAPGYLKGNVQPQPESVQHIGGGRNRVFAHNVSRSGSKARLLAERPASRPPNQNNDES
nr:hypothetical protein [Brevibacterium aurantiacum]